jgi:inorganic pyrophosphatase
MQTLIILLLRIVMDASIKVIIEIEKHSNQKWEYDRINKRLYLDRILQYPYFYPYAYGFVPNTLGQDGDELDVLLLSDKPRLNYNLSPIPINAYIVGGLRMEDEKGEDDKIFAVAVDEIDEFMAKSESQIRTMQEDIVWFFSNYKLKDKNAWSRVKGLMEKREAISVYRKAVSDGVQKKLDVLQKSL